jgi:hypothetical protein
VLFASLTLFGTWPRPTHWPPTYDPRNLPVTGIWRVTLGSMECFIRLHSEFRKFAPTLSLIIGVENDVVGDYGEHTTFHRLPPNASNAVARNQLYDLSLTPLIFVIDENVSFESDFVPALRHFTSLIFEGDFDIVGGCIRAVAADCRGYMYAFQETGSHANTAQHLTPSYFQTLKIIPIDLSSSTHVFKADAVDNIFLASKAALQSMRFDTDIEFGETLDFFLRSLTILRVGAASMLSANTALARNSCLEQESTLRVSAVLFHKWALKKIFHPNNQLTSLVCSDGQLDSLPESLVSCKINSSQRKSLSSSKSSVVQDPFPQFYARIAKQKSTGHQKSVGVAVVATGKYSKFLSPFIVSFRAHFLPKSKKVFFVFANSWFTEQQDSDVVVFSQHSLGWPYNSLHRFHMVLAMIEKMEVDYLFMADVDLEVISDIDDRILSDLVAAITPFHFGLPSVSFPFDRHPASPAYIHPSEGARYYFAGGFFGGSKDAVRSMLISCTEMADAMLKMKPAYVSPWHDESILNRFFHKVRKPTLIAGPEFLYPDPPFDDFLLTAPQKLYAKHVSPLMYNLGVRKAGADNGIRKPDPTVLRESNVSVIRHVSPIKPFSCSAVAKSESGLLCGMFVLSASTFSGALLHCSSVGMQLCSSKQLESLASSGYCNCFQTWAADGSPMQPQPCVSECKHCMKCGQFKAAASRCSSTVYSGKNIAKDTAGLACCRQISSDELVVAMSN